MPEPFHPLALDEFADLLEQFPFARRVEAVHVHHTWRPNHAQYRGLDSIVAMWRFHTQQNGWSDIAQHVTIAPDGIIWTGRDWNQSPASARGFNGNADVGPFMFELIGDFDRGRDRLEGPQREAAIEVIARVQVRFGLDPDAFRFHNQMTDQKTCPGTAVERAAVLQEIADRRRRIEGARRQARAAATARWADEATVRTRARASRVLLDLARPRGRETPVDAEPLETEMTDAQVRELLGAAEVSAARGGGGPGELTPAMLDALRPHVVNLTQGRFSSTGIFQTSAADVDAIFEDHLERWLRAEREAGRPLRLLLWAHGGLIDEATGLWIAHLQVEWWKRNNIYPLHFVWETGLFDALRLILAGALPGGRAARDVWDWTTDLVVEAAVRALGGPKVWLAMKRTAELAAEPDGGATYVARRLQQFCQAHPAEVEVHAVGHSAGAIFHSHFLPRARAEGVPALASLHFLAPAVSVGAFRAQLAPLLGGWARHLTMFTMRRHLEEADHVQQIYRKSLLYLIHRALEPDRDVPILGLETSVRADEGLRDLFGLRGTPSDRAEVVWSVSEEPTGRASSTSRSHGGFDNDRATMNSLARRVLGAEQVVDFPDEAVQRAAAWARPPAAAWAPPLPGPGTWPAPLAAPAGPPPTAAPGGRRLALCVGIDRYPTMPLAGCVADARLWARTLEGLGFAVSLLEDEAATRSDILDRLEGLLRGSAPGDVLVFQFAGHGTTLPDVDGDERDGDTADTDEALCPVDIAQGRFVIDDDVRAVFSRLPEGVSLTCFIDCCHSGTITRFAVGASQAGGAGGRRPRFLRPTAEMIAAHRAFRAGRGPAARGLARGPEVMREVLFSACLSSEVAWEHAGQGDFTRHATQALGAGGTAISNEEFQRRVTEAFGPAPAQHPNLDCAPAMRSRALLAPLTGGGRGAAAPGADAVAEAARALRTLADRLGG